MRVLPVALFLLSFSACEIGSESPDEREVPHESGAPLPCTWHPDEDGDGHGDPQGTDQAPCYPQPDGMSASNDDCDDGNATVWPGAPELCDNLDNGCDGDIDEELLNVWYTDDDGDGYGDPATGEMACDADPDQVSDARDCDDTRDDVYPATLEICNGIDDDCDSLIDDEDPTVAGQEIWYPDQDGDGWGVNAGMLTACFQSSGFVHVCGDCVDSDPAFHPGATEEDCTDPADYNCDGVTAYLDQDGDQWAACEDCDDQDQMIFPESTEFCNGVDDDCDGIVDEDTAADASSWHPDQDGDTHGDPFQTWVSCDAPLGWVADGTDCDDTLSIRNPRAAEICDGLDNDCNLVVDESSAVDAPTWYRDRDADGHGSRGFTRVACDQPPG